MTHEEVMQMLAELDIPFAYDHTTWLLMPYLASINNLSQAIVKNADKTMKITYTLTEQEQSPGV